MLMFQNIALFDKFERSTQIIRCLSDRYSLIFFNFELHPSTAMAVRDNETTVESLIQVIRETNCLSSDFGYKNIESDRLVFFDCDLVYPNIFIGDGSTAKEKRFLKSIGVTHVLNTAEGKGFSMVDTSQYFYDDVGIRYLGFPMLDLPSTHISKYFKQGAAFIQSAISSGGRVYVHCYMGRSRSSTIVIAYLMLNRHMTAAEAIRTVKQRRDIHPNEGFLQELASLDNFLRDGKKLGGYSFAL